MLVAITGKGPLKQHYERRVAGLALRRIGIATLSVARAGRLNYDDRASLLNLRHRHPLARAGRLPRAARLCRPRHAAAPPPLSPPRAASLHAARRDQASACTAPLRDSTCR